MQQTLMIKVLVEEDRFAIGIFDGDNSLQHSEVCGKDRLASLVNAFPENEVRLVTSDVLLLDEVYFRLPHLRGFCYVDKVKNLDLYSIMSTWSTNRTEPKKDKSKLNMIALVCTGVLVGCALLYPVSKEYKDTVLELSKVQLENYTVPSAETVRSLDLIGLYNFVLYTYSAISVESISVKGGSVSIEFTTKSVFVIPDDSGPLTNSIITRVSAVSVDTDSPINLYRLEGSYDSQ